MLSTWPVAVTDYKGVTNCAIGGGVVQYTFSTYNNGT